MAASLLHVAAAPFHSTGPPAHAAAFHPLASTPVSLRLARPSASSRRRLEASFSAGHRFAARGASRVRRVVATFAGEETEGSGVGNDKDTSKEEIKPEEAQEAWKVMLELFKVEALRMQALLMQAYDVYSKRTREVLLEAAEKLKIQADKAQKDLSVIAMEVSQKGQEYLMMVAQNSPNSIKDITMTFKALGKLNWPSKYEDYHVGIPFGGSSDQLRRVLGSAKACGDKLRPRRRPSLSSPHSSEAATVAGSKRKGVGANKESTT